MGQRSIYQSKRRQMGMCCDHRSHFGHEHFLVSSAMRTRGLSLSDARRQTQVTQQRRHGAGEAANDDVLRRHALEEQGVDAGVPHQGSQRQPGSECVHLPDQDHHTGHRQNGGEHQRVQRRDFPGGNGPLAGAGHHCIDFLVHHMVDHGRGSRQQGNAQTSKRTTSPADAAAIGLDLLRRTNLDVRPDHYASAIRAACHDGRWEMASDLFTSQCNPNSAGLVPVDSTLGSDSTAELGLYAIARQSREEQREDGGGPSASADKVFDAALGMSIISPTDQDNCKLQCLSLFSFGYVRCIHIMAINLLNLIYLFDTLAPDQC